MLWTPGLYCGQKEVFQILLLLQRERRATYRTLKYAFDIDDAFLTEVQEELRLRRLALNEEGKALVWAGESESAPLLRRLCQAHLAFNLQLHRPR